MYSFTATCCQCAITHLQQQSEPSPVEDGDCSKDPSEVKQIEREQHHNVQ
jgi:hypothetical protein